MSDKTLRVRARGNAMVVDRAALNANSRRFIGRRFDASLGPNGGWPPVDGDTVIPFHAEYFADYRNAVKDGDLWAADTKTAALCGVVFDPDFGDPSPVSVDAIVPDNDV